MPTTITILFISLIAAAIWAFAAFVRAARFASQNKERLPTILEKSSWWILLFTKGAFGRDVDHQRKMLAWQLLASMVLLFASIGLLRWFGS